MRKALLYQKGALKMLMKLTPAINILRHSVRNYVQLYQLTQIEVTHNIYAVRSVVYASKISINRVIPIHTPVYIWIAEVKGE